MLMCCLCVFGVLLVCWCVVTVLLKCCSYVVRALLVCWYAHNALWVFREFRKVATMRCGPFEGEKRPTTHCGIHRMNQNGPQCVLCFFFARKMPERVVGHLKCPERVVALFFSHNAFWAFVLLNERIRTLRLTCALKITLSRKLYGKNRICISEKYQRFKEC